jgi:hypothetical protein
MTNPEVAGQVKAIVDGGHALAQLTCQDELDKRLVDGLKVIPADKTLTVLWSGSAKDVWDKIEKEAKKIAEHREQMKKMGWPHRPPTGGKKPGSHKDAPPDPEI